MKPSDKNVTLAEFQAMSSEQRKALPFKVRSRLSSEDLVQGLNEATAKLPDPMPVAQPEVKARKAD